MHIDWDRTESNENAGVYGMPTLAPNKPRYNTRNAFVTDSLSGYSDRLRILKALRELKALKA